MSIWSRFAAWSGITLAAGAESTQQRVGEVVTIQSAIARDRTRHVSAEAALTLGSVFRAIDIHETSARQVRLRVERGSQQIATPALMSRPCASMSLADFMGYNAVSMYSTGDAFWELVRVTPDSPVVDVRPINPHEVRVITHRTKPDTYVWRGHECDGDRIKHLKFMHAPGHAHGLGPIQAANREIGGALDARDYGASWFTESATPEGTLTTDQQITNAIAQQYKDNWFGKTAEGEAIEGHDPRRLKVLGSGLRYEPNLLKPADLQFLESQSFTTTQVARLMGIPASLFLAAVEGTSQTYSNIEQDLTIYVRFSLMKVLSAIEEALSDLLPRGQRVRCNVESLLRADTKTRYEAHSSALSAGWLTDDEVRELEGRPPLTPEQRQQIISHRPTRSGGTRNE